MSYRTFSSTIATKFECTLQSNAKCDKIFSPEKEDGLRDIIISVYDSHISFIFVPDQVLEDILKITNCTFYTRYKNRKYRYYSSHCVVDDYYLFPESDGNNLVIKGRYKKVLILKSDGGMIILDNMLASEYMDKTN